VVQLLLDKGIDVEARDDSQRMALFNATIHGRKRIAHLLLEKAQMPAKLQLPMGLCGFEFSMGEYTPSQLSLLH
jgi:hypothetical protein